MVFRSRDVSQLIDCLIVTHDPPITLIRSTLVPPSQLAHLTTVPHNKHSKRLPVQYLSP